MLGEAAHLTAEKHLISSFRNRQVGFTSDYQILESDPNTNPKIDVGWLTYLCSALRNSTLRHDTEPGKDLISSFRNHQVGFTSDNQIMR